MEKNYMNPDSLMELSFIHESSTVPHTHENHELLFVLEGNLHVRLEDRNYDLKDEDVILINADRTHSFETSDDLLAVRLQISRAKVQSLLQTGNVVFWCNSAAESNEEYEKIRSLLRSVIAAEIDRGKKNGIYINSLYYQLLSVLASAFMLSDHSRDTSEGKDSDRMQEILDYIRANYREPISLQEVADEMFLSPTYLSKFVRRKSGKGFVELISGIRLDHAMEDLMYTDNSVARIAMDNGFASVAAFNKVFRDAYDTTPSEYRRLKKTTGSSHDEETAETDAGRASDYLNTHYYPQDNKDSYTVEEQLTIDLDEIPRTDWVKPMNRIMNAGTALQLATSAGQRETLFFKQYAGISHVRFWNINVPELYLDADSIKGNINFSKLDEVLDFLVNNKLRPYIELRPKAERVLGAPDEVLHQRTQKELFEDEQQRRRFYEQLVIHMRKRFGGQEVKKWIFDYRIPADTSTDDGVFSFHPLTTATAQGYFNEFDQIASAMRSILDDIQIGGGSFPVQHYGVKGLQELFEAWKKRQQQPSFISMTSFPYRIVGENGSWNETRRTSMKFLSEDIDAMIQAKTESGMGDLPLYVTECNLTLSDRSPLNDAMIKAAFLADASVQSIGKVDILGIWNARDAYSEAADSASYLFGGCGLLNKNGTPKPSFHVLEMINRMYSSSFTAGNILGTVNEAGHLKLMCHNLTGLNVSFYLKKETEIAAGDLEHYLESHSRRKIHIVIKNVPDYAWQIRQYRLGHSAGSLFDEWQNLGMQMQPSYDDMKYLERISVPRLLITRLKPENGILEFDAQLEPNEVQYMHITHSE